MCFEKIMLIGMVACGRSTKSGPGRYTALKTCIMPATQSNAPIMAKQGSKIHGPLSPCDALTIEPPIPVCRQQQSVLVGN